MIKNFFKFVGWTALAIALASIAIFVTLMLGSCQKETSYECSSCEKETLITQNGRPWLYFREPVNCDTAKVGTSTWFVDTGDIENNLIWTVTTTCK